jgi:hypothetical protein
MEYNKIALDTPDLLAVLKQRGLQVSNDKEACEILSAIRCQKHCLVTNG